MEFVRVIVLAGLAAYVVSVLSVLVKHTPLNRWMLGSYAVAFAICFASGDWWLLVPLLVMAISATDAAKRPVTQEAKPTPEQTTPEQPASKPTPPPPSQWLPPGAGPASASSISGGSFDIPARNLSFSYMDSEGEISTRRVAVRVVTPHYFKGRCKTRRSDRTFRWDRVMGPITDEDTGEMIAADDGYDLMAP